MYKIKLNEHLIPCGNNYLQAAAEFVRILQEQIEVSAMIATIFNVTLIERDRVIKFVSITSKIDI